MELQQDFNLVTIILNYSDVRQLLVNELKKAYNFSWTGWRIPIYLDGADDLEAGRNFECELNGGGWLSLGSWQPDAIEVFKVESWSLQYDLTDDMNEDDEIEFSIDDMLDNYDWQDKIGNNILEHFNNRFEVEYEVKVEWV